MTSLVLLLLLRSTPPPSSPVVVPSDGLVVTRDTVFAPGVYALREGLHVGADGVALGLDGVTLVGPGSGDGFGVSVVGRRGVRLQGGTVRGFFYGVRAEHSPSLALAAMDLSGNHVDPAVNATFAPWLDINAPPDLSDRVNLGGGAFLLGCDDVDVARCTARGAGNGFDLYGCANATLRACVATGNAGWGAHLNGCTGCTLRGNDFSRSTRPGLGDSAAILLVNGSHRNLVEGNDCSHSGDGFFIGNEHGCPSNGNTVRGNNCSYAGANAFEATFSTGNVFDSNEASHSPFGFWLGFSRDSTVRNCSVAAPGTMALQADHAQRLVVHGNRFDLVTRHGGAAAAGGILLQTDGSSPFPALSYPCLDLPAQGTSTSHSLRANTFLLSSGGGARGATNAQGLQLLNTTNTTVADNAFRCAGGGTTPLCATASADGLSCAGGTTRFNVDARLLPPGHRNVAGGAWEAGNYWSDYAGGDDGTGRGLGAQSYNASGALAAGCWDLAPLVEAA